MSTTSRTTAVSDGATHMTDHLADQAAAGAESAIRSTQQMAADAIDALRARSSQLRDKALQASDRTVGYIKDEPFKSVLIAAAAGAALMALATLVSRSRN